MPPIRHICGLGASVGCERIKRTFNTPRLKSQICLIGGNGFVCSVSNELNSNSKCQVKRKNLYFLSRISNVFDISQATVSEIIRGQRCNNAELFDRCIMWEKIINELNRLRDCYLDTKDYEYFRAIRQLLPSGYLQKSTVMLNYEVLSNIYYYRKDHKLDEWHVFCDWIKGLPYSELITGEYDG